MKQLVISISPSTCFGMNVFIFCVSVCPFLSFSPYPICVGRRRKNPALLWAEEPVERTLCWEDFAREEGLDVSDCCLGLRWG